VGGICGAFATPYFILYNKNVASSITAQGRDLTKTMDKVNEDYWYNKWHLDFELHNRLSIKDITKITNDQKVSIYADTDSVFVSFKPAIDNCKWKNLVFNEEYLDSVDRKFIILSPNKITSKNPNFIGQSNSIHEFESLLKKPHDVIFIDGQFIKDRSVMNLIKDRENIIWNWSREVDFIHGLDHFRYGDYFRECLQNYADQFGVENKQDFELERISESIINIAKKKYIQHIVYEDGIPYDRLNYIFPKGVELVRSSTPLFAREKIVEIVKYLFSHPDTFNIKDLLKLVKNLRREFELADIDDISMQSSCSNYETKVLEDKEKLEFVSGAHFAVKASAYYNYLLNRNKSAQQKYEFIKSGTKIKYFYCKNNKMNDIFAYIRGSYPIEFAPEICYDTQFEKAILSPINSIIQPLGMPQITKRLSVVMDIFSSGF
jgi:hypothetical protein